MTETTIQHKVDAAVENKTSRRFRAILNDAFAFVRSVEVNKAVVNVTLDELIVDQIKRNGESDKSNNSQYNPYSNVGDQYKPASEEPDGRANYMGGSDTGRPTKRDMILALQNEIDSAIDAIKKAEPLEVADAKEYDDASLDAASIEEEEL